MSKEEVKTTIAPSKFVKVAEPKTIPKTSYLFKELPLFRYEPWIYLFITVACVFVYAFTVFGFLPLKTIATTLLATLGLFWSVYMIKWYFYAPRGNKVLVAKCFRSTGIHLSVQDVPKDNVIHFDSKDETPPVYLTQINKHFDVSTGRPFLVCAEGIGENISIMETQQHDKSAKEISNIIKTTWGTAWQSCLNNFMKFTSKMRDPTFWLIVLTLIIVAGTLFLVFSLSGRFNEFVVAAEEAGTIVKL